MRLVCRALARVAMLTINSNLGYGYSQWPTYKDEYKDASAKWRANGGHPVDTDCQYFKGSSMPIWIKSGQGPISGGKSLRQSRRSRQMLTLAVVAA